MKIQYRTNKKPHFTIYVVNTLESNHTEANINRLIELLERHKKYTPEYARLVMELKEAGHDVGQYIADRKEWKVRNRIGERELVETEYQDRDRNYFSERQDILREEKDADNLKHYGHY